MTRSSNWMCQDGVPTRLGAVLIWVSAGLAMVVTGVLLAALAIALTVSSKKQLLVMLQSPAKLPTIADPLWVALGTASNELTILAVLVLWLWLLKASRRAVLPFRGPSIGAVAGALCLTFGLAPLAEVAGAVVHRWVKNPITASSVVSHAAKTAGPGTLILLVVCLALMPALVEEVMFRGVITASFLRRSVRPSPQTGAPSLRYSLPHEPRKSSRTARIFGGRRAVAAGILVPSLLFAVFHMEPAQVAGTFVLGLGFGVIRVMSDTMPPSMIAHGLYNAAVLLVVRESPTAAKVKLGAPVVALGLAVAAVGFGLLWLARRARLRRDRAPEPTAT